MHTPFNGHSPGKPGLAGAPLIGFEEGSSYKLDAPWSPNQQHESQCRIKILEALAH